LQILVLFLDMGAQLCSPGPIKPFWFEKGSGKAGGPGMQESMWRRRSSAESPHYGRWRRSERYADERLDPVWIVCSNFGCRSIRYGDHGAKCGCFETMVMDFIGELTRSSQLRKCPRESTNANEAAFLGVLLRIGIEE